MKNAAEAVILAWRLAWYQATRMKVRMILAALIIAAPVSLLWAASLADGLPIAHDQESRQQELAGYTTRVDAPRGRADTGGKLDAEVRAVVGSRSVPVVVTSVAKTFEDSCARCVQRIAWVSEPAQFGPNSQLVSGRWPTNSREVVVSDYAVAHGATSSGTISLKARDQKSLLRDSAPAHDEFTIVGVARTVLGSRHIAYTSTLDQSLRAASVRESKSLEHFWFVSGEELSADQQNALDAAGLSMTTVSSLPQRDSEWWFVLWQFLVVTTLACMLVSGVFSAGLGRMRQSLNIVLRNGGSKQFVLLVALMQGVLGAALVIAIMSACALGAVVYGWTQPTSPLVPRGMDWRFVPWDHIIVSILLCAALTLVTSVVPAVGLRYDAVVDQNKTYSGADASQDLAPVCLHTWVKVCLFLCFTLCPLFLVVVFGSHGRLAGYSIPAEVGYSVLTGGLALLGTLGIVTSVAFFQWLIARTGESLWTRERVDPSVRVALRASGLLAAMACTLVVVVQGVSFAWPQVSQLTGEHPGQTAVHVGESRWSEATEVVDAVKSSGQFPHLEVFAARRLADADRMPGVGERVETNLFSGDCIGAVGSVFSRRDQPECRVHPKLVAFVEVMPARQLGQVYGLAAEDVEALEENKAILLENPRDSLIHERPEKLTVAVLSAPNDLGTADTLHVRVDFDVVVRKHRHMGGWPKILIADEALRDQRVPLAISKVIARQRLGLTRGQTDQVRQLSTGRTDQETAVSHGGMPVPQALAAAFLGFLLALGSVGLTGRVRALHDYGASFWQRWRVVAQYCGIVSVIASLGATAFGYLGGGVAALAMTLDARPTYLSWFLPHWTSVAVVGCLPIAALASSVPLTAVWSRMPVDTGIARSHRGLTVVAGACLVAFVALFLFWLVAY